MTVGLDPHRPHQNLRYLTPNRAPHLEALQVKCFCCYFLTKKRTISEERFLFFAFGLKKGQLAEEKGTDPLENFFTNTEVLDNRARFHSIIFYSVTFRDPGFLTVKNFSMPVLPYSATRPVYSQPR